jgi:hypothetical protein
MSVTSVSPTPSELGLEASSSRELEQRIGILAWGSAIYLLLPVFIFAITWLRWLPAALLLFGVAAAILLLGLPRRQKVESLPVFLIAAIVGVLWALTVGLVGHYAMPAPDWTKDLGILGDLVRMHWPVVYTMPHGGHQVLRYYLGFFLVPALMGKIFGFVFLPKALTLWIATGLFLVVANVLVLFRSIFSKVLAAVGFVLFSGLDLLGGRIVEWMTNSPRFVDWTHLSVWSGPYEFTANSTQVLWVIQHALGGWLGTILVLEFVRKRRVAALPVAIFAALFWSPLSCLGVAVFAVAGFIVLARQHAIVWKFRTFWTWPVLAVGSLIVALYLTAGSAGIPKGFAWTMNQSPSFPWIPVILIMTWVVIYFVLAVLAGAKPDWSTWVAIGSLVVAPFLVYGAYDDFDRRFSIPALFVFCLFVLQAAVGLPKASKHFSYSRRVVTYASRVILCIALLVAAATPYVEWRTRIDFRHQVRVNAATCSLLDPGCSGVGSSIYNQYMAPLNNHMISFLIR